MRPTPALIAGGGPAGSVAALLLAQGGDRPLVLERSREPQDALCGGFLSWLTLESLANVGIDPATLGDLSKTGIASGSITERAATYRFEYRLTRDGSGYTLL